MLPDMPLIGEQTTYQPSNRCSRKDTPPCHCALQHHQIPLYQPELPADCTAYPCSILTNLRDSLYYMRQVAMHVMDYIDAATTGILSPHVLPVEDLLKIDNIH